MPPSPVNLPATGVKPTSPMKQVHNCSSDYSKNAALAGKKRNSNAFMPLANHRKTTGGRNAIRNLRRQKPLTWRTYWKTWTWASADQLTDATRPITYGVIKLGSKVSGGVPILRSSDVRRLELDLNGVKRIARKIADEYRRTYLRGGEVLITVRGTLGGVVAVPPSCVGYNISREVALLALLEQKASRLISFFIASDLLQQWLNKRAKGVAYTGINIETLRQLPLPVPPLDEQAQIAREVERRLKQAGRMESTIQKQFTRAIAMRQSILREAFSGNLVPQDPSDESVAVLLKHIKAERVRQAAEPKEARRRIQKSPKGKSIIMQPIPSAKTLKTAWLKIGKKPDAKRLFAAAGFAPEQVVAFYEVLRSVPEIRKAFEPIQKGKSRVSERVLRAERPPEEKTKPGQFRLVALWLENFKNLKDYEVRFEPGHGLAVVLGWNGTGKSNLFEALVIILRDLHYWWEKNKWPNEPMAAYRLVYSIEDHVVEVKWNPAHMKRPEVTRAAIAKLEGEQPQFKPVKREDLPLPRFVFGYYSGPTNRLAEHFLPMKRDHYDRLRQAESDDPETLASLLQQRRFFCAETHHAKYVLLAFAYKQDQKITRFLEKRLRILGFESALFVIRRPRWARKGSTPENYWGATGIMLRVMEKLRRFAIAPMVVQQTVSDGYRSTKEDHYFFFLPDLKSLHAFAAEYADARSFFLALESTDFSELIHDVKIQVRVKASENSHLPITFRELSEGEQQLLMVLGLMRFTKSHQSLVLLDEPDTHLNPHWSVEYLKDLASVISDDEKPSPEQQTSQLLMATHDPLVIASLLKEQVHLLKRDPESLRCFWEPASENPRGLGYTGILISDMFGFRSDLDEETLTLLERQVRLAGKPDALSSDEKDELAKLNRDIEALGFKTVSSDPYYRAFIEALNPQTGGAGTTEKPYPDPRKSSTNPQSRR